MFVVIVTSLLLAMLPLLAFAAILVKIADAASNRVPSPQYESDPDVIARIHKRDPHNKLHA